jgi:hypothetical protein
MGKSFKNEMQQSKPAAAKIINVGGGGDGDPEAVELKSKRLNLLLKPSIFTGFDKIRTMQRVSFNEAVNKALSEYVEAHADLIAKFDATFTDD